MSPLRRARLIRAPLCALVCLAAAWTFSAAATPECGGPRGTGDLGIVVERASGSVLVVNTTTRAAEGRIDGLGDLSHASAVYSRDGRFAYIFGRDGGLSKIDLLCRTVVRRIMQAGNSIGGAISQDGRLVAVSNYEPGGVRIFDSDTLELRHDIPAVVDGKRSKVVGLVDAPGQRFAFSLYDAGAVWVADVSAGEPQVTRFDDVGLQPYDALLTPDGRYYISGLFGEDGLALTDLWHLDKGVARILPGYGRGERALPVYKMPHLEGWALAGPVALLPAVGRHEVLVVERDSWHERGRVDVRGQPIFVVANPDSRTAWVNFALPHNDAVQVLDTESLQVLTTLHPGKGALHMEFTPRGEHVWISVRDEDRVDIYDTATFERLGTLSARKPSGIFFAARAHKMGL